MKCQYHQCIILNICMWSAVLLRYSNVGKFSSGSLSSYVTFFNSVTIHVIHRLYVFFFVTGYQFNFYNLSAVKWEFHRALKTMNHLYSRKICLLRKSIRARYIFFFYFVFFRRVSRNFDLLTRKFDIVSRNFDLVSRNFEIPYKIKKICTWP